MDTYFRPTWAEISLDALEHNINAMRQALPANSRLLASVKANAYGHGAIEIARAAERLAMDYLGVAFLDEALQLRRAGIQTPILVLGAVPAEGLALAREYAITISLFREDIRQAAAALPEDAQGRKLKVHIKADTGMGRLGVLGFDETISFIEACINTHQLYVEGLFTHYANADIANKTYTKLQYDRFDRIAKEIAERGWNLPYIHAANSAAGMDTPELAGNMVRFGIGMYGLYPSIEVNHTEIKLEPVMSLKSKISYVKKAPAGWGVSYGTRYFTKQEEMVGTLPIGYADGFSRMLAGKANVLVRGVKSPVLGTICMDQCMIGLDQAIAESGLPVYEDEEVVIIGKQGSEQITADDVADQLGTINYEVTCMLATRVPRVYARGESVVAIVNPLS